MTLTQQDAFTWIVDSLSGDLPHTCDLAANDGLGACTCKHHTCKRQPAIDEGRMIPKPCRHLELAAKESMKVYAEHFLRGQGLPEQFAGIGEWLHKIALWRYVNERQEDE